MYGQPVNFPSGLAPHAAVFWDLDGTLTDPRSGVYTSIQVALAGLGRPPATAEDLRRSIGPPLLESFVRILGDAQDLAVQAVAAYRVEYSATGIYDNIMVEGIEDCLRFLHDLGRRQFVVTSKPKVFADRVLVHFSIAGLFEGVYGPDLDHSSHRKAELVQAALEENGLATANSPPRALMIGDTHFDIEAAHEHRLPCVGVTWGTENAAELSRAEHVCETVAQLRSLLADLE